MHVLSIAPILPYPPDHGWRVRTWHLLGGLAARHEVTLLTWVPDGEPAAHLDAVRERLGQLEALPLRGAPRSLVARARRHAAFLAGGLPTYVQEMFEERGLRTAVGRHALGTTLTRLHAANRVDVIVFEEEAMRLMPLPECLRAAPVAVHRLEVFEPLMRELRRRSLAGRAYSPLERPRWARFDREVLAGVDLIVSTSEETAAELAPYRRGAPVLIVPNGVEQRSLRTPPADGLDVAVLGTMDYGPNVEGAVWFVRQVWPRLREQHPESRLRLVGRDPVGAIRELRGPDVEVTGTVPDVTRACEGVRVGVVPLRSGMGIKNKTLDFMSMGLPVVSTPLGAEGVAARDRDGLVVVPAQAVDLAEAVSRFLSDPALAMKAGAAARSYVARWHSWELIGASYADRLAELVGPDG